MVTRILVNWAKAIAAYEYRLNSRDSAFDKFVAEGPASGLISAAAKRGAHLFVGKAGCVDCHLGPQFTDDQFHDIGVPQAGVTVPLLADCPQGNAGCDCSSTATGLKCAPWGAYDGLRRLRDTTTPLRRPTTAGRAPEAGAASRRTTRVTTISTSADRRPQGGVANAEPARRRVDPALHARRLLPTLEEVIWHYNSGGQAWAARW